MGAFKWLLDGEYSIHLIDGNSQNIRLNYNKELNSWCGNDCIYTFTDVLFSTSSAIYF